MSQYVGSMMEYGVPTQEPWKIKVHIEMELKFMGMTQVLWLQPGTAASGTRQGQGDFHPIHWPQEFIWIHLGSFHAKSLDD